MVRKTVAIAGALAGLTISACGGRFGTAQSVGNGDTMMLPPIDSDLAVTATLPKDTIGEELPGEGLGAIRSGHWQATLGVFASAWLSAGNQDYNPQSFEERYPHARRGQGD